MYKSKLISFYNLKNKDVVLLIAKTIHTFKLKTVHRDLIRVCKFALNVPHQRYQNGLLECGRMQNNRRLWIRSPLYRCRSHFIRLDKLFSVINGCYYYYTLKDTNTTFKLNLYQNVYKECELKQNVTRAMMFEMMYEYFSNYLVNSWTVYGFDNQLADILAEQF